MTTLKQVLSWKGDGYFAVSPDTTIKDALEMMAAKNIGSMLVIEGEKLVGIITERHFARKVFLAGLASPDAKVGDVMSKKVIVGQPNLNVEEALSLMVTQRFRHMPVCDGDKVIGVVTMTDLVRSMVGDREYTINQLQKYLYGR